MFTGIIEELGRLVHIEQDRGNTHFTIEANMSSELKIDQSLAHDGCCLTVTNVDENTYKVNLSVASDSGLTFGGDAVLSSQNHLYEDLAANYSFRNPLQDLH